MMHKAPGPFQNLVKHLVAGLVLGGGEGQKQNTTINVKNPLPVARPLPKDQRWGSSRLLSASAKPPLAPLARLQSTLRTVSQGEDGQNIANSATEASAASPPASGLLGISSSLRGGDTELYWPPSLPSLPASNPNQPRPWSSLAIAVGAGENSGHNPMLEGAAASRSAYTKPIFHLASPLPPSIFSTPHDPLGNSSPMVWDTQLVGIASQNELTPRENLGAASGRVPFCVQTASTQTSPS